MKNGGVTQKRQVFSQRTFVGICVEEGLCCVYMGIFFVLGPRAYRKVGGSVDIGWGVKILQEQRKSSVYCACCVCCS